MKTYAYVRVSTLEQNTNRQLDAMTALGISKERIFTEKQSGKDTKRPQLQLLMETVTEGDKVIVESISRFARNTRDLLDLVEKLSSKGVEFVSLKEQLDTTTPTGKFMLTIFGAVAELEREYILVRQAEGIAAAKARGKRFGRPPKAVPKSFSKLVNDWEQGRTTLSKVLEQCGGISAATFYRRLAEHRIAQGLKK